MKLKVCAFIGAFSFFLLSAAAWRGYGDDRDACILAKFRDKLIQSYDKDENAKLPAQVRVDFGNETPESLFKYFLKIWKNGTADFLAQKKLLQKIAQDEAPTKEELASFKLARARFKQLRFAFASFDKTHEYPEHLDEFTTSMGKIQDALSNHSPDTAAKLAGRILPKWNAEGLRKIEKETGQFDPSSKKSFYRWIGNELNDLEGLLNRPTLSSKGIHDARKILARQNAVFFILDAVDSTPETAATLNYLSTWNAQLGDFHDDLVRRVTRGELDEKKDPIVFPPGLKAQALEYIEKMRAFLDKN
ncbi:MAG: hypothetical protein P4M08_01515 [Oligoflexia bacterium]|nr:hypothetical protein [Oligoflexia bacterium]